MTNMLKVLTDIQLRRFRSTSASFNCRFFELVACVVGLCL